MTGVSIPISSCTQAVQATCIAASGGGGAAGASAPPAGLALPNGAASTGTTSGGGSGPGGFPALPAGLPVHWAREFFLSHLCLACHQNQEALSRLQGLAQVCLNLCVHVCVEASQGRAGKGAVGELSRLQGLAQVGAWGRKGGVRGRKGALSEGYIMAAGAGAVRFGSRG